MRNIIQESIESNRHVILANGDKAKIIHITEDSGVEHCVIGVTKTGSVKRFNHWDLNGNHVSRLDRFRIVGIYESVVVYPLGTLVRIHNLNGPNIFSLCLVGIDTFSLINTVTHYAWSEGAHFDKASLNADDLYELINADLTAEGSAFHFDVLESE